MDQLLQAVKDSVPGIRLAIAHSAALQERLDKIENSSVTIRLLSNLFRLR